MQITQILIAVDQLVNTLFGGWADETISARAYRGRKKKRWYYSMIFIDKLFFMQKEHCKLAYLSEINRIQLPDEMR